VGQVEAVALYFMWYNFRYVYKTLRVTPAMNVTLAKALVALVPASMILSGSVVLFLRGRTLGSFLQALGAGCLVVVVLTHVSEALHLFPWMHWGAEHSAGHYLDLGSAVLGLTSFPVGYLLHALTLKPNSPTTGRGRHVTVQATTIHT